MAGAIGESGAMISSLPPQPLADAEQNGVKFACGRGRDPLAALRAMTAEQIQEAAPRPRESVSAPRWTATSCQSRCTRSSKPASRPRFRCWQARTRRSRRARSVLGNGEPTPETLANAIKRFYGDKADES